MPATAPRRFAALWRGINVGKAKRIAMADLREALESLGLSDVKTLLNSGNAVFSAAKGDRRTAAQLEAAIRDAVSEHTGVDARVMVLSAGELDHIIAENPLPHALQAPPRFLVAVLARDADRARLSVVGSEPWPIGTFGIGSRAAYLWCPDGISNSPAFLVLDKGLKDGVTTRNWATVTKLRALM